MIYVAAFRVISVAAVAVVNDAKVANVAAVAVISNTDN